VWQSLYDKAVAMLQNEDITRIGDRQTVVKDT